MLHDLLTSYLVSFVSPHPPSNVFDLVLDHKLCISNDQCNWDHNNVSEVLKQKIITEI